MNDGGPATNDASDDVGAVAAEPAPIAAVHVPMRRTPSTRRWWSVALMLGLGGLPAFALPLLWFTATGRIAVEVSLGTAVVGVVAIVGYVAWLFALPAPGDFVVDKDGLRFRFARRGVVFLALDEVLVCRSDKGDLVLLSAVVEGAASKGVVGSFVVPRGCFKDKAGGAHAVIAAVRAAMMASPHGPGLLSRLDDNAARQQAFAQKRPIVTWAVVGLCVALFAVEFATSALGTDAASALALVRMGANVPSLVRSGEVWRLVTACLLHGSVLHIVVNLSSLSSTGGLLERWLGRNAYVVVLFVTGVFSHAASAVVGGHPMSVGISGAIFGLLGVLLWSTVRFRGANLGGLRVPLSGWIFLLLTNAALSALPFIDVVAHGAGFAAGVVVAAFVAPRPGGRAPLLSAKARRGAAIACAVVVVASLFAALVAAVS